MTLEEATKFLGYTRSYIYKLVHWKKIPCHKPTGGRGRLFFKQDELEEFLYRNKQFADYEIAEAADAILNGETICKNTK
ncbi:helix-turn-helix domain-containing protein [Treponema sp. R80B11-R83G3]